MNDPTATVIRYLILALGTGGAYNGILREERPLPQPFFEPRDHYVGPKPGEQPELKQPMYTRRLERGRNW